VLVCLQLSFPKPNELVHHLDGIINFVFKFEVLGMDRLTAAHAECRLEDTNDSSHGSTKASEFLEVLNDADCLFVFVARMATTVTTKETILIAKAHLEILSRSLEPKRLMKVARKVMSQATRTVCHLSIT
jgi:hypothetical protein